MTDALPVAWIDGDRLPIDGPHVSVRDRGFALGDALFETIRLRHGTAFRLAQHRARLSRGLAVLEIDEPPRLDEWISAAIQTARAMEGLVEASLRVTVTRGPGTGGLAPPADARASVVVTLGAMPPTPSEVYERGLSARIARGRRNERAMTAGLKTTAYSDAIVAYLEARRSGADEAIFLDTQGRLSEATSSNLFAVIGDRLLTPPTSCGALPGITRAAVIEVAPSAGLAVVEEPFDLPALHTADEAFLTSALRGLAPLVRVDDQVLGAGTPGARTRRLMQAYAALIARECGEGG